LKTEAVIDKNLESTLSKQQCTKYKIHG